MDRSRWRLAIIAGLLVISCQASETMRPAPYAALVETCAPWDGAAITVFLTEQPTAEPFPPAPYSAISVYRSLAEVLGRRFELTEATGSLGAGQVCPSTGACYPARGVAISFQGLNPDSTVGLTYRLEASPGQVTGGRVRARLSALRRLCG
jgi:hypothetical protein